MKDQYCVIVFFKMNRTKRHASFISMLTEVFYIVDICRIYSKLFCVMNFFSGIL